MNHTNRVSATRQAGLAFSLLSIIAGCVGGTEDPMALCDDCDRPTAPVFVPDRPAGLDVTREPRLDIDGDSAAGLSATLNTTTLRVRRGERTTLEVRVDRALFDGEVAVWAEGLPDGLVADASVIPGSAAAGELPIVATEHAPIGGPFELTVRVAAVGSTDPIEVPAFVVVAGFPGRLDESFGTGGVTTVEGAEVDFDQVAVDTHGRVVVAGRDLDAESLFLERLLADGSPDETYLGAAPVLREDMPIAASRMVLMGDRAHVMMVAGRSADANVQVGLAAFDERGQLDEAFGSDGIVPLLALGSRDAISLGLAAGDGSVFFRVDGRLAAVRQSGSVDELTLPPNSRESGAMAYGDHTLTFGVVDTDSRQPVMLERVHTAGGRDERFGDRGVVRGPAEREAMILSETVQVVLLDDGSAYAAGNRWFEESTSGLVARFTTDGQLDPSFVGEGQLTFANERVDAIEIDARGGVLVLTEHWPSFERRIRRYSDAGELDAEFGTGGIIELGAVAPGSIRALAHDVTAERLLACGPIADGWRCARFWL